MKSKIALIFLATILALFCSTELMAQKKCKFDFDKSDPMSGERVTRNQIKMKSYFIVSLYRKGEEMRVELNVRFAGERNFVVPTGSEIKIKLGDGEILTLKSANEAAPLSYISGTQVMTNYAISYFCSAEEMEMIAKNGFSVVSTMLGNETLTYEVKEKEVPKVAEKASCILKG